MNRIEAVADPIIRALRSAGFAEAMANVVGKATAERCIIANDAWLDAQEKRNTTACPRCGTRCDVGDFECRGCGEAILWEPER